MYVRLALSILLAVVLVRRLAAQDAGRDSLTAKVRLAEEAAARWLALVDAKRYGASWDNAAASFKEQVSGPDWQTAVTEARSEVDPLGARRLRSAQYTRELPDAPPGDYVVIQYSTAARSLARVVETITLTLETSGAWRVVGYFIRPE
jgi:hypothetical protein